MVKIDEDGPGDIVGTGPVSRIGLDTTRVLADPTLICEQLDMFTSYLE